MQDHPSHDINLLEAYKPSRREEAVYNPNPNENLVD